MEQYIPKSALVAKINKRIMDAPIDCYGHQRVWAYNDVKDIIDTLEVKEVELSYDDYMRFFAEHPNFPDDWGFDEAWIFAKYFFELGLLKHGKENKL